jgi:hypothetical protein
VIGAAQMVPFALFALPAGTLVDRWPRRRTPIVCDIGRALAAGVNVIAGFTNARYDINQYTLRQKVTPDHLLGRVNATMCMIFSGPRPLGYLLGGGLAVWTSVPMTIFLGALVSTVSAVFVFFGPIRGVRAPSEDEEPETATT